jgi:hypothetical protein
MPSAKACWRNAAHRAGPETGEHRAGPETGEQPAAAHEVFADHRRVEQRLPVIGGEARHLHQRVRFSGASVSLAWTGVTAVGTSSMRWTSPRLVSADYNLANMRRAGGVP